MTLTKKDGTGLFQWVDQYIILAKNCPNGCVYCYAMIKEVFRFKRRTYEEFRNYELIKPMIRFKDGRSTTKIEKIEDWIMFPGTHDIFPAILDISLDYIKRHLEIGNKLLIVSKPDCEVIQAITRECENFKDQILFRFTMTSQNEGLLDYFEPNAPSFSERLDILKYCYHKKFQTSVSIEPFLEKDPIPLIKKVALYCTDSIWVGMMTKIAYIKRSISPQMYEYLMKITSEKNLFSIIRNIDKLPSHIKDKVYFKDSFNPILERKKHKDITQWLEVSS